VLCIANDDNYVHILYSISTAEVEYEGAIFQEQPILRCCVEDRFVLSIAIIIICVSLSMAPVRQ
jgi:hypothetical protein